MAGVTRMRAGGALVALLALEGCGARSTLLSGNQSGDGSPRPDSGFLPSDAGTSIGDSSGPEASRDATPEPCDEDSDGFRATSCGGDDCDDHASATYPGAEDLNAQAGEWQLTEIATDLKSYWVGGAAAAVDRSGTVHVAYGGPNGLHHLVRGSAQAWSDERVTGEPALEPLIAVDERGAVELVLSENSTGVRRASNATGSWGLDTVEGTGEVSSLAVEPLGAAHILYWVWSSEASYSLKYATNTSGQWHIEPLASGGAREGTLAVDSSGMVHAAWAVPYSVTVTPSNVYYALREGTSWQVETVWSGTSARIAHQALAVDRAGIVHLAFGGDGVLYYAQRRAGVWDISTRGDTGYFAASLALDAKDEAHLLATAQYQEVRYLRPGSGASFEALPGYWFAASLAVDAAGTAHAALLGLGGNSVDRRQVGYATNRVIVLDGTDQNCDGVDGVDRDEDGFASLDTGGDDCKDSDPMVRPEAPDSTGDGVDQDCDGIGACAKGLPGPGLVDISTDGGSFCIDSTEVTNAEYAEYLGSGVAGLGPPLDLAPSTVCYWNATPTPADSGTGGNSWNCPGFDALGRPDYPVVCVDWCDAWSYCNWAGKRLCGKIGGGAIAVFSLTTSQWGFACSAGGSRTYAYGGTLEPGRCVDESYPGDDARPVGEAQQCEGGYPGLYDMSGNVREWQDECATSSGADDACSAQGGTFWSANVMCGESAPFLRRQFSGDTGFRCCAD